MRPRAPTLKMNDDLELMQLDIDHYILHEHRDDGEGGEELIHNAIIRIYGLNH